MKLQNFKEHFVQTPLGKIFCRSHGNGPALLLLHGYPQTHLMWHKTAPSLSEHFTVIVADLRGYGDSMAPASDEMHQTYSKRAMAGDMIQLMDYFNIAGTIRVSLSFYNTKQEIDSLIDAIIQAKKMLT